MILVRRLSGNRACGFGHGTTNNDSPNLLPIATASVVIIGGEIVAFALVRGSSTFYPHPTSGRTTNRRLGRLQNQGKVVDRRIRLYPDGTIRIMSRFAKETGRRRLPTIRDASLALTKTGVALSKQKSLSSGHSMRITGLTMYREVCWRPNSART